MLRGYESDESSTSDGSSDGSSTEYGSPGSPEVDDVEARVSKFVSFTKEDTDFASSVTSSSSNSAVKTSDESSFTTPAAIKKKTRRTNAQIKADLVKKGAVNSQTSNTEQKKSKSKPKTVASTTYPNETIDIGEKSYPLQPARTLWSTAEQLDLIWSYKKWEDEAKLSQCKKLIPVNKLIPVIPVNTYS